MSALWIETAKSRGGYHKLALKLSGLKTCDNDHMEVIATCQQDHVHLHTMVLQTTHAS